MKQTTADHKKVSCFSLRQAYSFSPKQTNLIYKQFSGLRSKRCNSKIEQRQSDTFQVHKNAKVGFFKLRLRDVITNKHG